MSVATNLPLYLYCITPCPPSTSGGPLPTALFHRHRQRILLTLPVVSRFYPFASLLDEAMPFRVRLPIKIPACRNPHPAWNCREMRQAHVSSPGGTHADASLQRGSHASASTFNRLLPPHISRLLYLQLGVMPSPPQATNVFST